MTNITKPTSVALDKRKNLFDSIYDGTLTLSYSAIKEFAKSPRHFIKYKLKERKETPAMRSGTLLDCLLTTPDLFEEKYVVSELSKPSGKGELVCNAMLAGAGFDEALKVGGYTNNPNKKIVGNILKYVDFQTANKGKIVISQSEFDTQETKKNALYKNDSSNWILSNICQTQVGVKWNQYGFNWRGWLDMQGESFICDLKNIANHTPRKVKYTIKEMRYDWQAALYTDAINGGTVNNKIDYYIMAIDESCNITVMKIDDRDLNFARAEIAETVTKFRKCMFENKWEASYDFYASNGIYNYSDF